ncbi:MAG: HAMP domain-containing histidine kinase [Planctomycetaceae bacterium]|nr:HAMP domain-containing histidine kinase [Planctomycetaceae bacterium]
MNIEGPPAAAHALGSSNDERFEQAKLDAMKELAYGASHEINNPLANISARAQSLLRDERDPERRRTLEAINQQALRAHEMISDLMLFARPPQLERRPLDLVQLVRQVACGLASDCDCRSIELNIAVDGQPPPVDGDATQLGVAINALVANSINALGRDGTIQIAVRRSSDGGALLQIADNGPGIPPEVRPHIFDPFYSGREAGRGLGFGLSKAWRIITLHGGSLTVEAPAAGAIFNIELPKTERPAIS